MFLKSLKKYKVYLALNENNELENITIVAEVHYLVLTKTVSQNTYNFLKHNGDEFSLV